MQTCIFQNFPLCPRCSRLTLLYHRLQHQKQRMFMTCSEVVEGRKKAAQKAGKGSSAAGAETTNILNELLANESWLEQVSTLLKSVGKTHLRESLSH